MKEGLALADPKSGQYDQVFGSRPSHQHVCTAGTHTWMCNSPYCNDMNISCPAHGGPTPIVQGYEPWRH